MKTVYETDKITFTKFIDAISKMPQNDGRIFWRGEGSAEWALIPSLFRKDGEAVFNTLYGEDKPQRHISDLLFAEAIVLYKFYIDCKKNGLDVPDVELFDQVIDSRDANTTFLLQLKRFNPNPYNDIFNIQIPCANDKICIGRNHSIENLVAIAQHHGIPTRLIDWSYDMNAALYFAANSAIRKIVKSKNCTGEIAIWTFEMLGTKQYLNPDDGMEFLRLINAPYKSNIRQQSQTGLLMYNNIGYIRDIANEEGYESDLLFKSGSYTMALGTIENAIYYCQKYNTKKTKMGNNEIISCPFMPLKKYVLSYSELPKILNYLDAVNSNTSRYFPDYENIYKDIQEKPLREMALNIIKQQNPED